MSDADTIQLFVQVVELGSFSGVARQLGIRPSSVSRRIALLEAQLGSRLFNRTTRKLSLTEAGAIFYEHTARIVQDIDLAINAVRRLHAEPAGFLRVAAQGSFVESSISPLLPGFFQRYPSVRVGLSVTDRVVDFMAEGLDLAIRMGFPEESSLVVRRLMVSRSVVCCSPEYLSGRSTPTTPADLTEHDCICYRSRPGKASWRFKTVAGEVSVEVEGPLYADNAAVLRRSVLQGLGIAILPLWLIGDDVAAGGLVTVLDDFPQLPAGTPISAIFPHKNLMAPKVRVFLDYVAEHFSDN